MKVPRDAISRDEWRALEDGAVVCRREGVARFRLTGHGRIACLQGLVTCDVAAAADGTMLFGALLSPKGLVASLLWITRLPDALLVEVPAEAAPLLAETFAKSLPPRLCRYEDITAATAALGCYGPRAAELAPLASVPAVARGARGLEWFTLAADADDALRDVAERGAVACGPALLEAARILAGIPRLGAEVDHKTLPQEVRLDELGGVSFTKGCYVGQETVARLHFRGHANRSLALLLCDGEPDVPADVKADEKIVGSLTSAAWSEDLGAWVGQSVLRREVEDGAEVTVAGVAAVVRRGKWPLDP